MDKMSFNNQSDLNSFMKEASDKGMYVVGDDSTKELIANYDKIMKECDRLCDIIDPDTTPYKSKYEAREQLDSIFQKLEATRTIASLDMKKEKMNECDWRIASIRVRQGIIAWEVEEPHNCQMELGFIEKINDLIKKSKKKNLNLQEKVKEINLDNDGAFDADKPVEEVVLEDDNEEDDTNFTDQDLIPPKIPRRDAQAVDLMKCLNMLGILWAGRGQIKKSFLYLKAAREHYCTQSEDKFAKMIKLGKKGCLKEMENTYTHTLFYLAQAYGHIGDTMMSSKYCQETLQRQLDNGFTNAKAAMDWSKNCAGIADFFMALGDFEKCSLSLASAELIMNTKVLNYVNGNEVGCVDDREVMGDILRRWIRLDVSVLKNAFEYETKKRNAIYESQPWPPQDASQEEKDEYKNQMDIINSLPPTPSVENDSSLPLPPTVPVVKVDEKVCFFDKLEVNVTPYLVSGSVYSFPIARSIFLRAVNRIEEAKKIFPVDGHVTDYVNLTQEHSKLYHYLSLFETDVKRKLAMESRRVALLSPFLGSLNKVAFENLHKQISFELAETNLSLLEVKLDKLRDKHGGEIDVRKLKNSEIINCNAYCQSSLAMFIHFAMQYSKMPIRELYSANNSPFETMSNEELIKLQMNDPDESLISDEEIRPYLNAHFLSCRAMAKIIPPSTYSNKDKAQFLMACLQKYQWLNKYAIALCKRKQVDINDYFSNEMEICSDMCKLLPSKVDRMWNLGESGLSL